MRFLVDAQLPRRLARWLNEAGHDAVHTMDLPKGNRTPDQDINDTSISQKRVVITKDEEFVTRFVLGREPFKLLLFLPETLITGLLRLFLSLVFRKLTQSSSRMILWS